MHSRWRPAMTRPEPSSCGCRQCGGAANRADTLLARRVLAYAPFVAARRGQTAEQLRARIVRPTLYSRLVYAGRIAP